MSRSWRSLALGALLAGLSTAHATAATSTANFNVQATVSTSCRIVSATTLDFGSYDPTAGTALDQTSQVTVVCTNTSNYNVYLDLGSHAAGAVRQMAGGSGSFLPYELYTDTSRTTVWGQSGANGVAGVGTGVNQVLTVYGRIPASQNVPPGGYTDSVTATVSF